MNKHQEDLQHIRSMMERSSRFISLSGLSGVFAGVFALIGAGYIYFRFQYFGIEHNYRSVSYGISIIYESTIVAILVLLFSLGFGIFFTMRKSKKNNLPIWTKTTKKLLINLAIPLIAGGLFCIGLLKHQHFADVAPATLVFYGLALVNASKYTYGDIKYLGLCEILLGCIAMFFLGYGLFFWAIGFGIFHIIYGVSMYRKYK